MNRSGIDRSRAMGMSAVRVRVAGGIAICGILAAGWWQLLFLPLGASHDGRINGRFGLHVRNLLEKGIPGSDYLASMEPFSDLPYTHHPPLLNVLHALVGSVFGQGEWQLHLVGYVAGLGTVAGLIWLGRELDLGAGSSVVAMALVAATPMFWIYARLGLGVSLIVVFLALWQRCRREGLHRLPVAVTAAAAALGSWIGVLAAMLTSAAGSMDRQCRRMAMRVGLAGLGAAAVALVWTIGAGEVAELVDHTRSRLEWPPWSELVAHYRWFYQTLFPWWFRWVILPALIVSVTDHRTRWASAALLAAFGVWTLAAPGGAFIHDYWTYPLLAPIFFGLAALLDRIRNRLANQRIIIGLAVVLLALAVTGFARLPEYRDAYFHAPSDAGALIRQVPPAPDQTTAWVLEGVDPLPRWVSYYWDLPTTEITATNINHVPDNELVLVRLDQMPPWASPDLRLEARKGRYALATGRTLRPAG